MSSLFPSDTQPTAGLFIRERMFRVGAKVPIVVVAPQPWFPFQGLIRLFRPHFRPMAPKFEKQRGFEIHRPRFFCFPGILKWTDGLFMALSSYLTVRRIARLHRLNVLDAHFGYPDGYAATLLGRWLGLPVMITLRGKEERQLRTSVAAPLVKALKRADRLVCVSDALRQVAIRAGAVPQRVTAIGNGVDLTRFRRISRESARADLGLPLDAHVLISVGTLVERKGFHRVIECLPALRQEFPNLHYLVVGGPGPEGDISGQLQAQVASLGLNSCVRFMGAMPPERLHVAYSAADVFVLATSYEGWANVFLEAMACGLPVVTTRVGGNEQVVPDDHLGAVVEFGDQSKLSDAIACAVRQQWDRDRIIAHAQANSWDQRVAAVVAQLEQLASGDGRAMVASPEPAAPGRR